MQTSHADIRQISDRLYLIVLTPPIRGFDEFISVWLYRGEKTFIVDVGPSVVSGDLIFALQQMHVKTLDYILLTHIHLDHAGGIGDLSRVYPETPIICHPAGIDHLVDPAQLIEGTVNTLGDTGKAYGTIRPTARDRLIDATQFTSDLVFPVITPGHSPHHVSYQTDDYLFAGEAGGVCFPAPNNRGNYMRPATPPKFFFDVTVQSIDDLIARHPKTICFSHFGIMENAVELLTAHKRQLLLWKDLILAQMKKDPSAEAPLEKWLEILVQSDPCMDNFYRLDEAVQERERFFLYNSLKGFAGYLKTVGNDS